VVGKKKKKKKIAQINDTRRKSGEKMKIVQKEEFGGPKEISRPRGFEGEVVISFFN